MSSCTCFLLFLVLFCFVFLLNSYSKSYQSCSITQAPMLLPKCFVAITFQSCELVHHLKAILFPTDDKKNTNALSWHNMSSVWEPLPQVKPHAWNCCCSHSCQHLVFGGLIGIDTVILSTQSILVLHPASPNFPKFS